MQDGRAFFNKRAPTENEIRKKILSSDIIYVGGGAGLLEIAHLLKYEI
jgi:peptidase E